MRTILRILIVEDEDMLRKGLIHTMDWMAMDCTIVGEACNGKEGLQKIEEYKPDIVITDIIMPKMNGIEMIEAAKTIGDFKSIILTSYSEFEYAQKAINLRVFDYLLKPIDEEKLFQTIQSLKQKIEKNKTYNEILKNTKDKKDVHLTDLDIYIHQGGQHNPYIVETIKEIKVHYHQKISIEGVADTLGISASYLSRKFKEETSQTFLDILNKYRIQKAIELLEQGSYKVYEVSELTGFSEYKHFCSVFKKYTHMAPTEFVKNASFIIHKSDIKQQETLKKTCSVTKQ